MVAVKPVVPAIQEAEAGGSQVQGLTGLQRELQDSLGNLDLHLKIKRGLKI